MHPLWQMPARLPYERRGQQGIPQAEKRDRVHPLLRVYESLPHKSVALARILRKIYRRGMGLSVAEILADILIAGK